MTTLFAPASPAAWLLLILAAVTLWHSIRYFWSLRSEHLVVAAGAALGSLLLGALAFATGFQRSVAALGPETDPRLVLLGASESLSCLVLSLILALPATFLLALGGYRSLRAAGTVEEPRAGEAPSTA